jgi:putative peptidoglycan lipid II flippase
VSAATTPSVRFILNTALVLTALGMVVRASSAVKEIIFARAFGVSAETDAFVLAVTYATFLPTVLGGSVATALIAELAKAKAAADVELAALARWVVIAACLCAFCIYVSAPMVMSTLFNLAGDDLVRAVSYARVLTPLGFTMVVSVAMDGLLNSAKQFYVPGITALATPVFTLFAILGLSGTLGVEAAAWGMVFGGAVEVLVLASRIGSQRDTFFPRRGKLLSKQQEWAFWRSVAVLSFAAAVASASPIIDQVFLAKMQTGAITSLNYASKVNSLIIGIFGAAFGAAIYPYLSDLAAQRDAGALKRLTWRLAGVVLPITGLTSVLVYVFSYDIVELLFARGNFTQAAVVDVSAIQQIFAFQLVFYVAGLLAMRVLNAAGASRFVLVIACIGVVSTGLLDWLFYESMGARGIALAAVLTSIVSLIVSLLFIRPALGYRA